MRGSRKFRRGGGGGVQVTGLGQSGNVFFIIYYFLVFSLFYISQMVNFKENFQFSRFQRGPTFLRGVQLFRGGPIAYSYRNPFNL